MSLIIFSLVVQHSFNSFITEIVAMAFIACVVLRFFKCQFFVLSYDKAINAQNPDSNYCYIAIHVRCLCFAVVYIASDMAYKPNIYYAADTHMYNLWPSSCADCPYFVCLQRGGRGTAADI